MLGKLRGLFAKDLAIDLGTANTLIFMRGKGIILNEPSVVAINKVDGRVIAVGKAAKAMYGKTPETIEAIRPMKDGVIADFDITKKMISYFIRKVLSGTNLFPPKVIVCVPSGITQVEKKAVIDSSIQSGARKVHLIEEPMAAAIGSKLPIHEARGSMVIDIGGGTTEVAVLSLSATAYSESTRVAGDEMDEAIMQHIRRILNIQIGPFEAERVKMEIGSASPLRQRLQTQVRGRDLIRGVPVSFSVDDSFIRQALNEPVKAIVESTRRALEKTSPELSADITERGIVLAGGGALLKGLGPRLHQETGLPIFRAKDPLTAIVRGTGEVLENFKTLGKVCIN
ncbi:MAG: rod shape-determining protein [Candidatus Tectomicrobia bacterium]|uniref:Cell shape-determining protein MreB n=1 Tax=Tectimicrobiota bacterium TaxID=2528274 RepID=A0A932LYX2_UNCTE|nr:rod shape-determining protein [Candidatus Tectomicrobia bacterium]